MAAWQCRTHLRLAYLYFPTLVIDFTPQFYPPVLLIRPHVCARWVAALSFVMHGENEAQPACVVVFSATQAIAEYEAPLHSLHSNHNNTMTYCLPSLNTHCLRLQRISWYPDYIAMLTICTDYIALLTLPQELRLLHMHLNRRGCCMYIIQVLKQLHTLFNTGSCCCCCICVCVFVCTYTFEYTNTNNHLFNFWVRHLQKFFTCSCSFRHKCPSSVSRKFRVHINHCRERLILRDALRILLLYMYSM